MAKQRKPRPTQRPPRPQPDQGQTQDQQAQHDRFVQFVTDALTQQSQLSPDVQQ